MFNTSFALATKKGFQILSNDKKETFSVPADIDQDHTAAIAQRIKDLKPISMFRLSPEEFLLCYETMAVYINKHGDVSRSVIVEFVGNTLRAAMYGPYLLLFNTDFVEIRNANNGRLRQVISGRDIRCLDDGSIGGGSIKLALQHPERKDIQLILELDLHAEGAE
jgi:CNH domain